MKTTKVIFLAASVVCFASVAQARTVKVEPPMGALKPGQTVLVDDGRCPAGQIRQVTGGNHVEAGGYAKIRRISTCVKR